jgi:hypothetical protein
MNRHLYRPLLLAVGAVALFGSVVSSPPAAFGLPNDVTTWVGGPPPAVAGFADGPATTARFNQPRGLARDSAGNVFVADRGNNRIRMVTPLGVVSTLAGSGAAGTVNGASATASFDRPIAVASDGTSVFVVEEGSHRIRLVAGGQVTDFAGSVAGEADGPVATARFNRPGALAWEAGSLYVEDANTLRRVLGGVVTTLIPDIDRTSLGTVDGSGIPSPAQFGPWGAALAVSNGQVYFTDPGRGVPPAPQLRRWSEGGGTSTRCAAGQHAVLFRPGLLPVATTTAAAGDWVSIPLYTPGTGNVATSANVELTLNVAHARVGDVRLRLRSAGGLIVPLAVNRGGNGANYTNTKFVASGAPYIGSGVAPFSGPFLPESLSFAALNGAPVATGAWFLDVSDTVAGIDGTVNSIDFMICASGPGPSITNLANSGDKVMGGITVASGTPFYTTPGLLTTGVRKVGEVGMYAGSSIGLDGYQDGERLDARFRYPTGLVVGADGSLLAADTGNNVIRRVFLADTVDPAITLTTPTSQQAFTGRPIVMTGTATDDRAVTAVTLSIWRFLDVVQNWNGSAWQNVSIEVPATLSAPGASSTSWTYSFIPPASGGYFSVVARAVDASGRSSTTPGRSFTLPDAVPPTAIVVSPVMNAVTTGAVTVTGTAADNIAVANVRLSLQRVSDGAYFTGSTWIVATWPTTPSNVATTMVGAGTPNVTWSKTFTPPTPGAYRIVARAIDTNLTVFDSPVTTFAGS